MGNYKHQITFDLSMESPLGLTPIKVRIFKELSRYEDYIKKLWDDCGEIGAAATLVPDDQSWIEVVAPACFVSIEISMHELAHATQYYTEWNEPPEEWKDAGIDEREWFALVMGAMAEDYMIKLSKYFDVGLALNDQVEFPNT